MVQDGVANFTHLIANHTVWLSRVRKFLCAAGGVHCYNGFLAPPEQMWRWRPGLMQQSLHISFWIMLSVLSRRCFGASGGKVKGEVRVGAGCAGWFGKGYIFLTCALYICSCNLCCDSRNTLGKCPCALRCPCIGHPKCLFNPILGQPARAAMQYVVANLFIAALLVVLTDAKS